MNIKAFIHNKIERKDRWELYILCGDVDTATKPVEIFAEDNWRLVPKVKNYYKSGEGKLPDQKALDILIAEAITDYETELITPVEEPESPEITHLKELGVIDATVKVRSVTELKASDLKPKEKTAPMQKMEATLGVVTPYTLVDDFVEEQFTDEQQNELANEAKRIKGGG